MLHSNSNILLLFGNPPLSLAEFNDTGIPFSKAFEKLISIDGYISHATQPGLGAVTLGTFAKTKGINLEIKDWFLEPRPNFEQFGIIGISTASIDMTNLRKIANEIRLKNPDCVIIGGGPLSWSFSPKEILSSIPELDIFVNKEGELTFVELINCLKNKTDFSHVKGISFRINGGIQTNAPRTPMNPEDISIPDWSLIDLEGRIPLLPIETMRGCLYNCSFCSEVTYWGKPVRFRPISSIVQEVESNITRFGINTFRFSDSCFSAPEDRCIQLCNALYENFIKKGIILKWSSFARITNITDNLIEAMQKAGCVALDIGMESGNETILKKMKKNYSRNEIISRISIVKNHGILAHCNVVVGFPGESNDSIQNTITILNEASPDTYHCMLLFVASNTDLSLNRNQYRLIGDGLQWQHPTMTSEEALKLMPLITANVTNSCLFISGEIATIMMISTGYTPDEVRTFYQKLQKNNLSEKEYQMAKHALLRKIS